MPIDPLLIQAAKRLPPMASVVGYERGVPVFGHIDLSRVIPGPFQGPPQGPPQLALPPASPPPPPVPPALPSPSGARYLPAVIDDAVSAAGSAAGSAAADTAGAVSRSQLIKQFFSRQGLKDAFLTREGLKGTWSRAKGGAVPAMIASTAGTLLDDSGWLGGKDSDANDLISKILKWGGAGTAVGSVIPGVGNALGALAGAAVGATHFGLERAGVLGGGKNENEAFDIANVASRYGQYIRPDQAQKIIDAYRVALIAAEDADKPDEAREMAKQMALQQFQQTAMENVVNPPVQTVEEPIPDPLAVQATIMRMMEPYLAESAMAAEFQKNLYDQIASQVSYPSVADSIRAEGNQRVLNAVNMNNALLASTLAYPGYYAWQQQERQVRGLANQILQQQQQQMLSQIMNPNQSGTSLLQQLAAAG